MIGSTSASLAEVVPSVEVLIMTTRRVGTGSSCFSLPGHFESRVRPGPGLRTDNDLHVSVERRAPLPSVSVVHFESILDCSKLSESLPRSA